MTIRILRAWNGYFPGAIVTNGDAATEAALVQAGIASFTLTGGNNFIPNDPYSDGVTAQAMLWADRPSALVLAGHQIRFQDVGGGASGTGGGNLFFANGSRWKPLNGSCLLDAIDSANSAVANTTEQQLSPNRVAIPAGLLMDFDRLRIFLSSSKNGTTDTTTLRVRFGPLGTVADPALATITALATTNQSYGTILQFKRLSATTVQKQGAGDPNASYGGPSATAYPAAVTVSNMDTSVMFLSITSQMTGGTEVTTLQDMTVELCATDS